MRTSFLCHRNGSKFHTYYLHPQREIVRFLDTFEATQQNLKTYNRRTTWLEIIKLGYKQIQKQAAILTRVSERQHKMWHCISSQSFPHCLMKCKWQQLDPRQSNVATTNLLLLLWKEALEWMAVSRTRYLKRHGTRASNATFHGYHTINEEKVPSSHIKKQRTKEVQVFYEHMTKRRMIEDNKTTNQ